MADSGVSPKADQEPAEVKVGDQAEVPAAAPVEAAVKAAEKAAAGGLKKANYTQRHNKLRIRPLNR